MADNVTADPGSGGAVFATDDIGGVHFPRTKIVIGDNNTNDGDVSAANPLPVDGSGVTQPVSAASLPLPTGAATSAKQDTGNTSLASIDGKITAVNTGAVVVSSSALPTGASTAAKQPALGTAGSASADVITIQGIASMTAVKVDGSGVTQPVSGTVTASNTAGNVAHDAADSGNPVKVGARARSSDFSAVASDDRTDLIADLNGKLIVLPYAIPENFTSGATNAITDTTSTSVIAAAGAGVRLYVTSLLVTNSHATVGTLVTITDGSGGSTLYKGHAAAAGGGFSIALPTPLRLTANTALHAVCGTTGSNVYVSATAYKAP